VGFDIVQALAAEVKSSGTQKFGNRSSTTNLAADKATRRSSIIRSAASSASNANNRQTLAQLERLILR
jgi:hypothetical protein